MSLGGISTGVVSSSGMDVALPMVLVTEGASCECHGEPYQKVGSGAHPFGNVWYGHAGAFDTCPETHENRVFLLDTFDFPG